MLNLAQPVLFHARRFLWNRNYSHGSDEFAFTRRGTRWTVLSWDRFIGYGLYMFGEWQFKEIDIVLDWLADNRKACAEQQFVIDAGANIGSTSIHLAKHHGCKVLAIEPVPQFYKLLQENVKANALGDRILCHQSAIYDCEVELDIDIPDVNAGAAEVRNGAHRSFETLHGVRESVKVCSAPLSSILKQNDIKANQVSLVWSDTQGCEGHVLRTGSELWESGVPLVMEYWPEGLGVQGETDVSELISKYFKSFSVVPFQSSAPSRLDIQSISNFGEDIMGEELQVDILLIP